MRAIFIFLFPSLAFAFVKGVPYQKTEICEKIKADYEQAQADYDKAQADYDKAHEDMIKACGDLHKPSPDKHKPYEERNKAGYFKGEASDKISKAYKDAEKYKCFKDTPACSESVKDMAIAHEDGDLVTGLIRAVGNVKKYCQ